MGLSINFQAHTALCAACLCLTSLQPAHGQDDCAPFQTNRADLLEGASHVQVVDFDADGILDLVAVSTPNLVQIIKGRPDGSYEQQAVIETGEGPSRVHVHDFNADTTLDILVIGFRANNSRVHLNNGDGTFQQQTIPVVGYQYVRGSIEADIDNDGDPDYVALYSSSPSTIATFLNNGDGTFEVRPRSTYEYAPAYAVSDLNNDGIMDLVAASYRDDVITVYHGSGNGAFTAMPSIHVGSYTPRHFEAADLNNDDYTDLAVVTTYGIQLLFGDAQGELSNDGTISAPTGYRSQAAAHHAFKSGPANLVVVGQNQPGVAYFQNDGLGAFTLSQTVPLDWNPTMLKLADLDQDEDQDVIAIDVFTEQAAIMAWDEHTSSLQLVGQYQVGRNPAEIIIKDMNSDSRPDVVIHNTTGDDVSILFNEGQMQFSEDPLPPTIQLEGRPVAILTHDFDQDNREDLAVVTGDPNQLLIIRRDSGAVFETIHTADLSAYPNDAIVTDIDQDGHDDVVCMTGQDKLEILYGPEYDNPQSINAANYSYGFTLIDINGDGLDDFYTHQERFLINEGNREYTPLELNLYEGITQTYGAVAFDADMDGDQDIALYLESAPQRPQGSGDHDQGVYLYTNDSGTFSLERRTQLGNSQSELTDHAKIDANQDGITDLVISSGRGHPTQVYLGNGDATFTPITVAAHLQLEPSSIADVNADDLPDIIAARPGNDDVIIVLADPNGGYQSPISIDTGQTPIATVAHDADGDGDSDIISADNPDRTLSIVRNLCQSGPGECLADTDMNGFLSNQDVLLFLQWYTSADPRADLNQDQIINFYDIPAFILLYQAGCS